MLRKILSRLSFGEEEFFFSSGPNILYTIYDIDTHIPPEESDLDGGVEQWSVCLESTPNDSDISKVQEH